MPAPRPLAALAAGLLITASLLWISSCGANQFTLAPGVADAGAQDAPPNADVGPVSDAGVDAPTDAMATFCQSLSTYYARCRYTATCNQTNLLNCGAEGFALSGVARRALIHCEPNLNCTPGSDFVRESCVRADLTAAVPTAPQAKLASDYCAACAPTAAAACSAATFYSEGLTSLGDGPGFIALLYNDTLINSIDKQCIPVPGGDAGSCDFRFRICEVLVLQPQVPGDACRDGGL